MIKAVTCCNKSVAWFESITGCLVDQWVPKDIKIWGGYFTCTVCGHVVRFDGLKERRKNRLQSDMKQA